MLKMYSAKLLHFINTAEPKALTSLPGVGTALAERLCAARPFLTLEDCCRVRGVTPHFIHRLEAAMPDPEPESPLEITPIKTEDKLAVAEEIPTPTPPPPPEKPAAKPAAESGLWRFLKGLLFFLLRLAVILLLLAGLAIGIAYLAPLAYERYLRPVEMNVAQVAALETQQAQSATQIANLQARLETAEAGQATQGAAVANLTGRFQNVEADLAEHTKNLAALEEMQAELLETNETSLANMSDKIERLKALEMLARARLFLYQSNFGLARQDAQSARELLAGLQPAAPTASNPDLEEALFRLDLVLKNLPDFPVAASDDLDLAWLALAEGIPTTPSMPIETATATPTPMSIESATPTPAADFTATPVEPVASPTATP